MQPERTIVIRSEQTGRRSIEVTFEQAAELIGELAAVLAEQPAREHCPVTIEV